MLGLIKGEYFKQHGQGYLTHLHIGLQSKKGKFLFCLFALVELSGLITGGYFEQHEKGNFTHLHLGLQILKGKSLDSLNGFFLRWDYIYSMKKQTLEL